MSQPLILVAVDVRRGRVSGTSRAGKMKKIVFPSVKHLKVDDNPGGGVLAVRRILPRLEAFEPAFTTAGPDLDIFAGMGEVDVWTLAGAYRDPRRGLLPARAIIEAAVGDWEPGEGTPDEFQDCTHSFAEILHAELHIGGKEYFYVDSDERILRFGGVDHFASVRRALGA